MDIKKYYEKEILFTIEDKYWVKIDSVPLENPPKKEMGDFCFGAFHISKHLKKNPNAFSEELKELFDNHPDFSNLSVSGPFVNFSASSNLFLKELLSVYKNIENISKPKESNGETIVVDYIWTNLWKPLHIGHLCPANLGQAVCDLYRKLGYEVVGDSHIWDWGIIFWKLITAIKIYGGEERLEGDAIAYLFEMYVKVTADAENNPELEERTREEFKLLSEWNEESIKIWQKATEKSIENLRKELDRLNIRETYNIWESFYEGLNLPKMENYPDLKYTMNDIVAELIEKKIAVRNDDNSVWITFAEDTKMPSCILEKRNWTKGYFASDLASIKYRVENWSPAKIIYCTDNRQMLHFKQAFNVAGNAGWTKDTNTELVHAMHGAITLKDGAMSTRKGTIIPLSSILDEATNKAKKIILEKRNDITGQELEDLAEIIWVWAVKYGHISKNRTSDIVFDWGEFMTFEGKSGPYIAYNFVRANKILNENTLNEDVTWDMELSQEETELIKAFGEYEDVLLKAADSNSPHIIAQYAYDISKKFSSFYNACRIDTEDEFEKATRLKITALYKETVKDAMNILWIILPEKM